MTYPQTATFADDGAIPNAPLPVLLYRGVAAARSAAGCEELFARHGWTGSWRDGVFTYHHFHSTAHEVLGIAAGSLSVRLGGPGGETFEAGRGDVLVLPAGTGHRNVGQSADLLVVGAYPGAMAWDIRRGDPAEHDEVLANIGAVPLPAADPVHGPDGPLRRLWVNPAG